MATVTQEVGKPIQTHVNSHFEWYVNTKHNLSMYDFNHTIDAAHRESIAIQYVSEHVGCE